jgi:ABC-type multidrug transport system ATPase subunit
VNGAGKTTTFRMLTADERPTSGNGLLLGRHDLRGDANCRQRSQMGWTNASYYAYLGFALNLLLIGQFAL